MVCYITVTHNLHMFKFWQACGNWLCDCFLQYRGVIMGAMASQITSLTIVYSTVYSGADQRKHQSSTSLAFVRGIHRRSVNSPHKWPVTRKMFSFDDVIMPIMILFMYLVRHIKFIASKMIYWFRLKYAWHDRSIWVQVISRPWWKSEVNSLWHSDAT